MSIALELYDVTGIREDHPRVVIDALNASHFATPESRSVLIQDRAYRVIEIIYSVEFEELDYPIDVVKVRLKPN
jgi:hypothetical protein